MYHLNVYEKRNDNLFSYKIQLFWKHLDVILKLQHHKRKNMTPLNEEEMELLNNLLATLTPVITLLNSPHAPKLGLLQQRQIKALTIAYNEFLNVTNK
jgi:hypothetical protein